MTIPPAPLSDAEAQAHAVRAAIIEALLNPTDRMGPPRTATTTFRRSELGTSMLERRRGSLRPLRPADTTGDGWFAVQHGDGPVVTSEGTFYASADMLIAELALQRATDTMRPSDQAL